MHLAALRNITNHLIVFVLVLVLPILLAFVFSIFGYPVSDRGASSQLINNKIVGWILALGTFSIVVSCIVSYALLSKFFTANQYVN